MYFVYILQSIKDNSYYIGYTSNLTNRIYEHNYGRTRFTKLKRPWKLVCKKEFVNKTEALKKEKYLKRLKSKKYLAKIIELMGP